MVQFASLAIVVCFPDFICNLYLRLVFLVQAFIDRLQVLLITHKHHLLKISLYLTKHTYLQNVTVWVKISQKNFYTPSI